MDDKPSSLDLTPPAGLRAILRPRSVAVIGASNRHGTIGAEITRNLVLYGFHGPVYPVNPKGGAVQSIKAYADVRQIPDPVDLAIIIVPQPHVLPSVEACIEKGVKGIVVITAGFKEAGPQGQEDERRLTAMVREAGVSLIGPNCLGVVSTDPATKLDATFAPTFPTPGNIAVASQSGALGVAMLDYAKELNIGVSDFVSMGNKADVSGNDLISWWAEDERTKVILLYLESFGNPQRFAAVAQAVTQHKPIVAVKSGRSARGLMAASSHTGSLAGADVAVQALVEKTGIIRVDTVEELFDMAAFLAHQPVPRGRRVAILTNAGGPGILATDAAEAWGLEVPDLPQALYDELAAILPAAASARNPVDMIASATPAQFEACARLLLASEAIDALIVLFVPPIITDPTEVGLAIARGASGTDKPVLSCFMGRHGVPQALAQLQAAHIPSYAFPESAIRVLSRAARYGEFLRRPAGTVSTPVGFDGFLIHDVLETAHQRLGEAGGWLSPLEVEAVLRATGLELPAGVVARSAGEAATAAREMGFPVVIKLVSEQITHKSDVGGVKIDLRNETDVFGAWEAIHSSLADQGLGEAMSGVLVQPMVGGGVETIVGLHRDAEWGPLIMFGLGGVHVELLRDVCFRIPPLSDRDAHELVRAVKGYPLLDGYRGAAPVDVAALEKLLIQVSHLATAFPLIAEMDLNPIKVQTTGCLTIDARIRIEG